MFKLLASNVFCLRISGRSLATIARLANRSTMYVEARNPYYQTDTRRDSDIVARIGVAFMSWKCHCSCFEVWQPGRRKHKKPRQDDPIP